MTTGQPSESLLKQVSGAQKGINADLDTLAKKYGAEILRIGGQRYFKHQREQAALKQEIAEREEELRRLQKRAQR